MTGAKIHCDWFHQPAGDSADQTRALSIDLEPLSRAQVLGGECWIVPVLANGILITGILVAISFA